MNTRKDIRTMSDIHWQPPEMLDMETQGTATKSLMLHWSDAEPYMLQSTTAETGHSQLRWAPWVLLAVALVARRPAEHNVVMAPVFPGPLQEPALDTWAWAPSHVVAAWLLSSAARRVSKEDRYVCAHGRRKECLDLWRLHILTRAYYFVQQWNGNMFCHLVQSNACSSWLRSTLAGCLNHRWCLQWRGTGAFLRIGWAARMHKWAVPISYWSGWDIDFRNYLP